MKRTLVTWAIVLASASGAPRADILDDVSRPVAGRTRRASSGLFDPESNRDSWHLGPGEKRTLAELSGPGEIRHAWFTIAGRDRRHPRNLVLRMYWDGADVPSVETPVGDFFAAGNGMRAEVTSPPVQVTSYGRALNCYWRMPFARSARIELENQGRADLCVYWQFDWLELPEAPRDLLYFHARYRQEFPARPFSPYVIFEGAGEGQYVGTVFSLLSSFGSWFGESDDRFFIDGELEPSLVGTGTEDYFLDAWNLRLFSNAGTGVTIKEPNGEDCRFTAYRWHLWPPVTFRRSLRVEIERRSFCEVVDPATGRRTLHDFKYRPDFCSSVAFWYQRDVAAIREPLPPAAERVLPEIVLEVPDAVDSIRCSEGVTAERRSNRVCNEKRMLLVRCDRIGGWFEAPFRVESAGRYSVSIFQRLFRTEGIWKVTLRGPEGEVVLDPALDFFDSWLALRENQPENIIYGTWREAKVGIHRLEPGDHAIRFECVGSNPLARAEPAGAELRPGLDCGLDAISLRRLPWDDLAGWMERYLAEEAELFRRREETARGDVARLGAAIDRFRADVGTLPVALEDLVRRPPSLGPAARGSWPYLPGIARDPWGQEYRYEAPGRFRPEGFDVWSVRGDSRAPGGWIGNWPAPFRFAGAIEGEDLSTRSSTDGARASVQELSVASVPPLSGGKLLFLRFPREGARIELALPPIETSARELAVRLVTATDYGTIRLGVAGGPSTDPVSSFSPRLGTRWARCPLPPTGSGPWVLEVEVVGQDPFSTGCFAGIDAVLPGPPPPGP